MMSKGKKVFSKGGKMVKVSITRNLPEKGKEIIVQAFDKMIRDQFSDYDWT